MPRPHRAPAATALAAGLVLIAGCTSSPPAQDRSDPDLRLGPTAFHDQEPTPADCQEFLLSPDDEQILQSVPRQPGCSRVEVPVDYADLDGETAQLAVMRFPATGEKIGSLLVNPGGPGQPGTSFSAVVSLLLTIQQNPIAERFDIVGFDPRGIGASTPAVDCFTDAERDADPSLALPLTFPAAHYWTEQSAAELAEQCAEGSGGAAVLENLGTRAAVEDLDVLRAVLGDEKLTYAGGSYGARLGSVYAETYPERVRALALDGTPSADQSTLDRLVGQAAGIQGAFDDMAAWCAEEVTDCPFGSDPARAGAEFQRVVQPLAQDPLPTPDGRELTFSAATGGALNALFAPSTWDDLVTAFGDLRAGRPEAMMAMGDAFFLRNPDGGYVNFNEANVAWNCNDEDRSSPEGERAMREQIAEAAPILDPGVPLPDDLVGVCASWPGEQSLRRPYAVDVEGLPPTLVMAVTGDPATPAAASEQLAEQLGGVFLPVEGRQHGAMLVGMSDCVDGVLADYLIDLQAPAPGETCALPGQEPEIG